MLVIYNAIIHEKVLLQGVSVTCMLEVTASSLMSSCSQICWEVIPSSAPSLTRTALPEILWGLFLLVKRKTQNQYSSDVIGLKCGRELTQSVLASGSYVCEGQWRLCHLTSWTLDPSPPWNPIRLLDSSCILYMSNLHTVFHHFLWSGLKSCIPSSFPMVSSTTLSTLWTERARANWLQDAPFELSEIPGLDWRIILLLIAPSGSYP